MRKGIKIFVEVIFHTNGYARYGMAVLTNRRFVYEIREDGCLQ